MSTRVPRVLAFIVVSLFTSVSLWAQKPDLPFRFEENRGQGPTTAKYIGWAEGYVAEMHPQEVLIRGIGEPIRMSFGEGEKNVQIQAADQMPALTQVYNSRNGQFYSHLRNYGRLIYSKVYPGIDVVFRGTGRSLEFDFVLEPHADYRSIRLDFSGQSDFTVTDDGALLLKTPSGEIRLLPAQVYQESSNDRTRVKGRYVKTGPNEVRFDLGAYDVEKSLVIDPQIIFGSYTGGSGRESAIEMAMGPNGAVALYNVYRRDDLYSGELYIVSFNASGVSGYYRTDLVDPGNWYASATGYAIAVDNQNNIALLVSMAKWGPNPPWAPTPGAFQTRPAGITLVKFGTNQFASYLGGTGNDVGTGVAFDAQGNIYVTGTTASADFPTRNAYQSSNAGGYDAFVTRVNSTGTQILYSTYFGGSGDDRANDIGVDAFGNIYMSGATSSNNLPTANALQSSYGGGTCSTTTNGETQTFPCRDMFVTKMNPAGSALIYSTYIGGSSDDVSSQMALTPDGDVLLRGGGGLDFPLTSSVFTLGSVLLRLDRAGNRLAYSMRFPTSTIATDSAGHLYVTSRTSSAFPVILNSFIKPPSNGITVSKFDSADNLIFSTIIHGTFGSDSGGNEALIGATDDGKIYVASMGHCRDGLDEFPVTNGTHPYSCNITSGADPVVFVLGSDSGTDTSLRYSRVEENYPMVKYSGTWLANAPAQTEHSMGRAVLAIDPGASFSFNFSGSEVHWFGCKDEWAGIAKVTLDDVPLGEVDTYMTPGRCGVEIWSKTGLGTGPHTLKVEVAGRRNASSASSWIWLDKIEITSAGDARFDAGFAGTGTGTGTGTGGGSTGGSNTSTFTRVEQIDAAVAYYGAWYTINSGSMSGGSAAQGLNAGDRVTFTFTGTAARWIGYKDQWSGIANVYVDGALQTQVDTYSANEVRQAILYTTPTLPSGTHSLTVEATYTRNAAASSRWVWVDAFESTVSGTGTGSSGGSTGGGTGGSTGGGTGGGDSSTFVRAEQNSSSIAYTGAWYPINSGSLSGGSAVQALDAGARATFTFSGTAARWIGYKDQWSGIANVYVDGVLQTQVDTYSAADVKQAILYTTPTLAAGTHTLAVEATYTRNASASSRWVWVDAFESTATGTGSAGGTTTGGSTGGSTGGNTGGTTPGSFTRVEQTSSAVNYAGAWYTINNGVLSGGSAVQAMDAGARATFTFTGTQARWVGYKDPWSGIAKVYIDGVLQTTVDTYSATDAKQVVLYTTPTLTAGTHTLAIEVTGTRNASGQGRWVWVDAFEFVP